MGGREIRSLADRQLEQADGPVRLTAGAIFGGGKAVHERRGGRNLQGRQGKGEIVLPVGVSLKGPRSQERHQNGQWEDVVAFGSPVPFTEKFEDTGRNWRDLLVGLNADVKGYAEKYRPDGSKLPSYDDMLLHSRQLPEAGAPWNPNQATAALLPMLSSASQRAALDTVFKTLIESGGTLRSDAASLPHDGSHVAGATNALFGSFLAGGELAGAFGLEAREGPGGVKELRFREPDASSPEFKRQALFAMREFLTAVDQSSTPTGM